MAAKAGDIQVLIDRLQSLVAATTKEGSDGRQVLRAVDLGTRGIYQELGVGADGKLSEARWNALAEDVKLGLQERLAGAVSALQEAHNDEPSDPDCFMFRAHASNEWVYMLVGSAIVLTGLLIYWIYKFWHTATIKVPEEAAVLRMVVLMGALGGTIHWMSSVVNFIGNGNLMRRWIPYYVLAPFQGAALAVIVYLALRVGVLSPATGSTQHMNLLGLYAFAGLTGLFAKQAIEMLRDLFGVVFKKVEAKDASGARKPPGAGGAGAAGAGNAGGDQKP